MAGQALPGPLLFGGEQPLASSLAWAAIASTLTPAAWRSLPAALTAARCSFWSSGDERGDLLRLLVGDLERLGDLRFEHRHRPALLEEDLVEAVDLRGLEERLSCRIPSS